MPERADSFAEADWAGRFVRYDKPMRVPVWLALSLLLDLSAAGAQDRVVYGDQLGPGFQDWSWAVRDLANTDPVAQGTRSIAWEADGWTGLYFRADTALDLGAWAGLRLHIHGGVAGGQLVRLLLQLGSTPVGDIVLDPAPAGAWETRLLDFRAAGMVAGSFDGIIVQDHTGADQPTLFLDHIELIADDGPPPSPVPVGVVVDPNADRRPIRDEIYGVSFGEPEGLDYPLRRWGGNATTRYNWRVDVWNTASDWFFQNIVGEVVDPTQLPAGSGADRFVAQTLGTGGTPILTAPAIGWAPLDERNKRWSFSVADYGAQLVDECSFFGGTPPPWCTADSGNGTCDPVVNTTGHCAPNGSIVGNDPLDTSQPIGVSFTVDWMRHLAATFGSAADGGVRYWAVDNEPMLWNSTHRDVHPDALTYDDLWSRTVDLGVAIKTEDPDARVLGPVVWGWCAYFTSASDAAFPNGSCVDGPDRQAHGGQPLLAWYLEQVCAHETATGVRPVDLLDVHFYPQGGVAGLGAGDSGEDPATAARRLRATRELWDPTWVSESWIGEPIYLLPRLRSWIDDHCPGVGIAVTEYRWGADDGLSSALAQVDVLGIFGREGVDMAARWTAPEPSTKVEDAFALFLDYDGAGSRVVGDSVRARADDDVALGSYAVHGADDTLWLVLVNREPTPIDAAVSVAASLVAGDAAVYRLDGAGPLGQDGIVAVSTDGFDIVLPARSASLVVARLGGTTAFADGFESGDTAAWSLTVP